MLLAGVMDLCDWLVWITVENLQCVLGDALQYQWESLPFFKGHSQPPCADMPVIKAVQCVCEIVYRSHDSPIDTSARVPYFAYQLVKKKNWHWSRIQKISFRTKNTNRFIYTVHVKAKQNNVISSRPVFIYETCDANINKTKYGLTHWPSVSSYGFVGQNRLHWFTHQAITRANADLLSNGPLGTNLHENRIKIW